MASMNSEITIIGLRGMPEVKPGDDLAALIIEAAKRQGTLIADGDVLVVKQKIVSKAEGRLVDLRHVEPSDFALQTAEEMGKDPRHVEVVLRESKRIVKMGPNLIIAETRHGFVCANAGVDTSNVGAGDVVSLLPLDPDASAEGIRIDLAKRLGVKVGVIISDSMGRPWRTGLIDVAIGIAGLKPLEDYVGQQDPFGYTLKVTMIAIADELASAAELVTGKLSRVPVALIKGCEYPRGRGKAKELVMEPERDLFR